jgi:hypothetical protein
MKRLRIPRGKDLSTERLPEFDWSSRTSADIVQEMFRAVEDRALDTIKWYLTEKERKAFWSRSLRVLAVIGIAIGAATPLAMQISGHVNLIWGYIAFGFAALVIGIDKVLGLSVTWARYMTTAADLQHDIYRLQLEWARISARSGEELDTFDVQAAWALLLDFSDAVADKVKTETLEWSAEFSSQLSALDSKVGSRI